MMGMLLLLSMPITGGEGAWQWPALPPWGGERPQGWGAPVAPRVGDEGARPRRPPADSPAAHARAHQAAWGEDVRAARRPLATSTVGHRVRQLRASKVVSDPVPWTGRGRVPCVLGELSWDYFYQPPLPDHTRVARARFGSLPAEEALQVPDEKMLRVRACKAVFNDRREGRDERAQLQAAGGVVGGRGATHAAGWAGVGGARGNRRRLSSRRREGPAGGGGRWGRPQWPGPAPPRTTPGG